MQMQHHFTVPAPVEVAWPALLDVEGVAPCMPGATLTKVEGNEFGGSVKVKLGPISLLYKGSGTFTEIDPEAHRVVIEASGKDSRGNGTAAATVTAVLSPESGSTSVTVDTDLKVTGKPAQFGRGLISEVGSKIIGQFADCLSERLSGREQAEERAVSEQVGAESTLDQSAFVEQEASGAGTPEAVTPRPEPVQAEPETAKAGANTWRVTAPDDREAIDLLDTAGAPVLKRLAPVAAALAVVAAVVLLRRRRRR
ncbi:carbon monoxide dehydrogenase subunit G [Halopolyspora algeriensis]|uniref:Carbon monoxide dehydrogenase subunit G n=1 Tax=Halopolyspora algeriensis TaxID=1500506 RepID=A0A368VSY9_9ACTN|nr:SRPBCC family protein [Halopolyspora algeriensis]RCW43577.1 carbon monoxide dehydrogenase subunit G [Halopolyspora algeriensis]TQM47638.1 carbon monoxide dehydrogenase subunit G [Halopolyspora algeriensis]